VQDNAEYVGSIHVYDGVIQNRQNKLEVL